MLRFRQDTNLPQKFEFCILTQPGKNIWNIKNLKFYLTFFPYFRNTMDGETNLSENQIINLNNKIL